MPSLPCSQTWMKGRAYVGKKSAPRLPASWEAWAPAHHRKICPTPPSRRARSVCVVHSSYVHASHPARSAGTPQGNFVDYFGKSLSTEGIADKITKYIAGGWVCVRERGVGGRDLVSTARLPRCHVLVNACAASSAAGTRSRPRLPMAQRIPVAELGSTGSACACA